MTQDAHQKVKATHLKRSAYLYVRQSTLRQVLENTESTERQYSMRCGNKPSGWDGRWTGSLSSIPIRGSLGPRLPTAKDSNGW